MDLPTYSDVESAAARIEGYAHRTPVLTSRLIDEQVGAQVFFKCENFQRIGAFKFRGAFNTLSQFTPVQRRAGVVAYSSGNHAQAIALAATLLDIPAVIVMPSDAPAAKLAATKSYGAEVVTYDRYIQDREQIGTQIARERGMMLVPPYDHPHIIAGQGTAAKELLEDVGALDALFVPLGGGGLLSGTALAARALSPNTRLIGVEPEAGNDAQQSFRTGAIVHIDTPKTIADGAQTQHLGAYTFEIIRHLVDEITTVSDSDLVEAMRILAATMKIIVEPTGCLGFAAVRASDLRGRRVGVILTGGNIDLDRFATLVSPGQPHKPRKLRKPTVAILGTGGTIAGLTTSPDAPGVYEAGAVSIADLVAAIPGLQELADLRSEQVMQIDSVNMDDAGMLTLARRAEQTLADDDIDALVITHGTDTLEESAYLLHLLLNTAKPVVFTGAMRPADAISADGPGNLRDAVAVAASPAATDKGVLAVLNHEIHSARDVTKTHTHDVGALQSPYGPLGHVTNGVASFHRAPARLHTWQTGFSLLTTEALGRVAVVYAHAGMSTVPIEALVESGTEAIIHAGMGNGYVPAHVATSLRKAHAAGVIVVRASRSGEGPVVRNAAACDDDEGWLVVDDQNPHKARILLAIALAHTRDLQQLQEIFCTY